MAAISQLLAVSLPGRRVGSFAGKAADAGAGPHPVGILSRMLCCALPGRRYVSFAGKTATDAAMHHRRNVAAFTRRRRRC